MVGDHTWKHNPPWGTPEVNPNWWKISPVTPPIIPPKLNWTLEQLQEYYSLLKAIKELEDQVGCPCPEDRDKPDYLKIIAERIAYEKAVAEKQVCKCKECKCGK